MVRADLILLVSGSLGVTALILWILLRRRRLRSQLSVSPEHAEKVADVVPPTKIDDVPAIPEPVDSAARDGRDDYYKVEGAAPTVETTSPGLGVPDSGQYSEPTDAAKPGAAARPADTSFAGVFARASSLEAGDANTNEAAATTHTARDSAEIIGDSIEGAALTESGKALLAGEGLKELTGITTAVVVDVDTLPVPTCNESGGAIGGPVSLPPVEGNPAVNNDGYLANTIGDAGSQISPAWPSRGKSLTVPDSPGDTAGESDRKNEEPSAQDLKKLCIGAAADRLVEVPGSLEIAEFGPDSAAPTVSETVLPSRLEKEAGLDAVSALRPRPSKPTQHRDRRGQRRSAKAKTVVALNEEPPPMAVVLRPPAEAKLRLMIHPGRKTIRISAALTRPAGYPDRINLLLGHGTEVGAYGEDRYDDIDLDWTPSLLSGELRLDSSEGYQWLRSARRIHIFSEMPDERGLLSVGAASLNSPSVIVCTQYDVDAVRAAAAACGSPELSFHDNWIGVPAGWAVLAGYRPTHAASTALDPHLTVLDPGVGAAILLSSGLQVRSGAFAEGSPPRIQIQPFPIGAKVTIDGIPAEVNDGCWRATGWDKPGEHVVDVIPGPSLSYRILGDPWAASGWESWDAHADRFPVAKDAPWALAQICGGRVSGPSGEHVVASESKASVIVLGLSRGMVMLRPRAEVPVAVGLLREQPAFLISSTGPRRTQGRIDWLVPSVERQPSQTIDLAWVATVQSAAARKLLLTADSLAGLEAWRRVRVRARRYRKAGT